MEYIVHTSQPSPAAKIATGAFYLTPFSSNEHAIVGNLIKVTSITATSTPTTMQRRQKRQDQKRNITTTTMPLKAISIAPQSVQRATVSALLAITATLPLTTTESAATQVPLLQNQQQQQQHQKRHQQQQ